MSVFKTKTGRWLLLAVGFIAVVALATQQANLLSVANRFIVFFRLAGPLPFFLAMAFLPMVGCPLSPFTLVAGPVFGPTMGVGNVIACAILAVAVNVALSYWIADRAL